MLDKASTRAQEFADYRGKDVFSVVVEDKPNTDLFKEIFNLGVTHANMINENPLKSQYLFEIDDEKNIQKIKEAFQRHYDTEFDFWLYNPYGNN